MIRSVVLAAAFLASIARAQPPFVDAEPLSGVVDGSNTTFTLRGVPNPPTSLAIYRNGLLLTLLQDYTASDNTIQFLSESTPQAGDTLVANYRTENGTVSPQQIDPTGLGAGQAWIWNGSSYVPGAVVTSTGNYLDPPWIGSLAFAKITGVPAFELAIPTGTAGQYMRGDKSWQTLNAAAVANAVDSTSLYSDPPWLSISKTEVGLSNVENTTLSTWTGSANLATVGTLTAGSVPWTLLADVPASFTPSAHAPTHAVGGSDELAGTLNIDITGNAGTVTNGLYATGSYADPGWLTGLNGAKLTAGTVPATALAAGDYSGAVTSGTYSISITGNAGTVTNGLYATNSYADPGWLTGLNGAKLTAGTVPATALAAGDYSGVVTSGTYSISISGNAATVTNGVVTSATYTDPSWLTISKNEVGLSQVENTALSTWTGTANITTIGTLAAGTVPWARLSGVPAGVWSVSGSTINYNKGNVGIGTTSPQALLHVAGSVLLGVPTAQPVTDTNIGNSQMTVWYDQTNNRLAFRVKSSTGTLKTGYVSVN